MGLFEKLSGTFRGARKIEVFIGIALAAVACMLLLGNTENDTDGSTDLEARMERALSSIAGAGDVSVLVNETEDGKVTGVLVVAQGADDLNVRLNMLHAVRATLDVELSRIEIMVMEGS